MKIVEADVPESEKCFGVLGILSRGFVRLEFFSHMLDVPKHFPPVTHWQLLCVSGQGIVEARNMIAKRALKLNAKYLAFVDDDTFIPKHTFSRFFYIMQNNPKIKLLTGVSWTKGSPSFPLVFKEYMGGPISKKELLDNMGKIIKVHSAGLGCALIDMEVIKAFKSEDWFNADTYRGLSSYEGKARGGDITFFKRAKQLGFDLYCDTTCQCDHLDVHNMIWYPSKQTKDEFKEAFKKVNENGLIEDG